MQTGWRLERTYFAGAGFNESRLEGLDIGWSEPLEPTGHAALWADNGTGKTTITALRFALYLPDTREFIRGDSDRSLAKLVRSNEVCHVVEQATRVVNGEVQRIVVGLVAAWADGTQDLDNPSRLERLYYGWVTGEHGPSIDNLQFRAPTARWATSTQFLDTLRGVLPGGGVLPPHKPDKNHTAWHKWLIAAGIDLEQVRFQTVMNASEGGVDRVMRFRDSDAFAAWLIGAITPTSTVDQIGKSIEVLRTNAAARPRWTDELELWQRLIHPMLGLAVAYEDVTARRRALAAAEANAATIVADADATISGLRQDHATATEQLEYYEQRRKDAGALLRRAQAHRLRMQHRAVHLRADEAEAAAGELLHVRDAASEKLAAWRLVANVLAARVATSQLAGLTERLAAVEKETADLQRAEQQHRNALARLLTERREQASAHLASGKREQVAAERALTKADEELASALDERATTEAKTQRAEEASAEAEQVLTAAIENGLIDQDDDPTAVDEAIKQVITDSRAARKTAIEALRELNLRIIAAQKAESDARRKAATAREDVSRVAGLLREADDRTESLAQNRYVIDALGGNAAIDLWQQRHILADALKTHASSADSNADQARSQIAAAKRIRSSIGADGLLPAPTAVEEAARRCRENADLEIPAWPGWRWLADTMTPQAAAEFALARPDIVSGVVVAHPDLVDDAVAAIGDLAIDSALWVGAVHDSTAARDSLAAEGTRAQVLLPPSGMYDRDSASRMLAAADQQLADASDLLATAQSQAVSIRETLASLNRLWTRATRRPPARLRPATGDRRQSASRSRDSRGERHCSAGRPCAVAERARERARRRANTP